MKKAFEKIEKSLKILLTYVGCCDNIIKSRATRTRQAAVAQAVERRIGSAEVTGPIPVSSFLVKKRRTLKIKVFRFFRYLKESGTIWYASLANSQSDVL